ncbi:MAG TPA: protoglobin family protein [Alphaproteobacteria bacterium]|nr:protoglobin family protein [Alphaproteobacteria bacterium]
MNGEPRYLPGADMEGFLREIMSFVGFDDIDAAIVRRTAPALLKHERAITDALYEHFLKFPATARFFLLPDGTPDQPRLERRKHSLGRWLRETAEAALTHDFSYYLLAIGLSHSHRSHGPGGTVPPHFMVATMSLAQTTFARIFQEELADLGEAFEASLAWNKLLLIQLNVLLIGYLLPRQGG